METFNFSLPKQDNLQYYFRRETFSRYRKKSFYALSNRINNFVCDSFLLPSLYEPFSFPQKFVYSVSRFLAGLNGVEAVNIDSLLLALGYVPDEIRLTLTKVKKQKYDLVLLGLGGSGTNLVQWVYALCQRFGIYSIFHSIFAFDPDMLSWHNMFRFPLPTLLREEGHIPYKSEVNRKYISMISKKSTLYAQGASYYFQAIQKSKKPIAYGAPEISCRKYFSEAMIPFFCATHQEDTAQLILNPIVDESLLVESYGKIDLTGFLMNQLKMVIEFLIYLEREFGDITKQSESRIGTYRFFEQIHKKRDLFVKAVAGYTFVGIAEGDENEF